LQILKDDKRAIFTAAPHASKAAEYLHGLQPQNDRKKPLFGTLLRFKSWRLVFNS
jgi:antirestriction protein ArdC